MCLKLSFSHSKLVLQAILSLCQFKLCFWQFEILTPLFSLTVPNFEMFFMLLNRKFNKDPKNVLKTVICSLQMGFTGDFVTDCPLKL